MKDSFSDFSSCIVDGRQVSNLQVHGIGAAILSGNAGINEVLLASEWDVSQGKYRLIFTAPEAITGNSTVYKWSSSAQKLHMQDCILYL